MELGLPKFIIFHILVIVVLVLYVYFFTTYIDVKIFKISYIEHGKRIALLNAIAESSDMVMKDSNDQPKKIIFLKDKLNLIEKNKELDCCYYYDYDQFLEIIEFRENNKWKIGFDNLDYLFKKGKECKAVNKQKYIGSSSIPIVVFDGVNYNPGVAIIKLSQTPLSNIAYTISVNCMKDEDSESEIRIYGVSSLQVSEDDDGKEICVKYVGNSEKFCKKIYCDKKIVNKFAGHNADCYDLTIKFLREGNIIEIT